MGDDDLSFEQLMAMQGVQQLPSRKSGAKARPAPARIPAGRAPPPVVVPPLNPLAARVTGLEAERAALLAEREEAQVQVAALEARITALEAGLAAAQEATAEAEADRDLAYDTEAAGADEIKRLQAAVQSERDTLTGALQARRSVAQVLDDRGCADALEMLSVLNGLLLQRPREFLEALVLTDPHGLARVLVERVAFVARGVPFEADGNTVVVHVAAARCEVSGLEPHFHGFVQACLDREITKVTIVGGSAAYRKRLRALAEQRDDAPALNLVSGTSRREARRAQADMRGSDVVVIWGGTELDHSVSAVYRGGPARVIRVAHRGLAGMLQGVRSALRKPA